MGIAHIDIVFFSRMTITFFVNDLTAVEKKKKTVLAITPYPFSVHRP